MVLEEEEEEEERVLSDVGDGYLVDVSDSCVAGVADGIS